MPTYPVYNQNSRYAEYATFLAFPDSLSEDQFAFDIENGVLYRGDGSGGWVGAAGSGRREDSLTLTYDDTGADVYTDAVSRSGFSDWEIDGTTGELKNVDTSGSQDTLYWTFGHRDTKMEVTWKFVGAVADLDVRFTLRTRGVDNMVMVQCEQDYISIVKEVGGSQTTLFRTDVDWQSGQYYKLTFTSRGHWFSGQLETVGTGAEVLTLIGALDHEVDWAGVAGVRKDTVELWISDVSLTSQETFTFTEGFVWPGSGTTTPDYAYSVYGWRQFAPHLPTSDLDFHRGIDVAATAGVTPAYAIAHGVVNRLNESHFNFGSEASYNRWFTEVEDTVSGTDYTYTVNTDDRTFDVESDGSDGESRVYVARPQGRSGAFSIRMKLAEAMTSGNGQGVGIELINPDDSNRYIRLYWGNTLGTPYIYLKYKDGTGSETSVDQNLDSADYPWIELNVNTSTGAFTARYSDDGRSWTDLTSSSSITTGGKPEIGMLFINRSLSAWSWSVDFFGYTHPDTPERFGNWVQVLSLDTLEEDPRYMSWNIVHFDEIEVEAGQVVEPGDRLGIIGDTGWDDKSGTVLNVHIHLETLSYAKKVDTTFKTNAQSYFYDNLDPVNPLNYLPRRNTSDNVSITITDEDTPYGDLAYKVRIVQNRAQDNDFDVNEIEVVGAVGSQTINMDQRTGWNEDTGDDADAYAQGDIHIFEPDPPFGNDTGDATDDLTWDFYPRKNAFAGPLTVTVRDINGTVLASAVGP